MENNTNNDKEAGIKAIRDDLLKTEWVEEAKQIPLKYLPENEQELLIKCINKEDLTEIEVNQLSHILNRFRKSIREQKPNETLENAKNNIKHSKNVKDYIEILRNSKKSSIYSIMYPISDNEEEEIPLRINNELTPLATQLISNLQTNLSAFADYTPEEQDIYSRHENGETLSEEDMIIAKRIESELIKVGAENYQDIRETAIQFLAVQSRIAYDETCTYEDMIIFYEEMKTNVLIALFEEVQRILGVNDIDRDKIFRKFN